MMTNPSVQWFLSLVKRRKWVALALCLVVGLGGVAAYVILPREYHATFAIEILQDVPASGEVERLKELLMNPKGKDTDEYSSLVRSQPVVEKALRGAGVIPQGPMTPEADYKVYKLRQAISVEREANTNIMTVYVGAIKPDLAETLATHLLGALEVSEKSSRVYRLEQSKNNLDGLLRSLDQKLNKVRTARDSFVKSFDLEKKLQELQLRIKSVRTENEKETAALQRQRQALLENYTDDWYEIREIDDKVRFLVSFEDPASRVASAPGAQGAATNERRESYRSLLHEQDTLLEQYDPLLLDAWRKHDAFDSLQAVDDELRRIQENIDSVRRDITRYETAISTSASRHRVVKRPIRPQYPSYPNPVKVALWTVMVALILVATAVYLMASMDGSLQTMEDVHHYAQIDTLALIPHMDHQSVTWSGGHPLAYGPGGQATPQAEAFRTLKSNVIFSVPQVTNLVVLLTSSEREEGKSTVCSNLAMAFAEDRRVLLLSCNLRRPTVHKILDVPEETGMADVLEGGISWRHAVKPTSNPNLSIITHGRIAENSSVLLSRPAFTQLVAEARAEYDAVLIDSPPALLLIDAAILAPRADAIVVVYSLGETPKESLFRSLRILRKVKGNVVGIAANTKRNDIAAHHPRYYYYQQEEKKR